MEILEIKKECCIDSMKEYLSIYGWHFSKKMCEWAVSMMKNKAGKITPYSKEDVSRLLKNNGIELEKDAGYDSVYIANMAKADFLNSSIVDESHLAKYIKDVIDDPDGYCGLVFMRFYADCRGSKTPIIWEDLI